MNEYVIDENSNVKQNETLFPYLLRRSIRESSKVDMWKREAKSNSKSLDAQQHQSELESRKWETNLENNLLSELEAALENDSESETPSLHEEQAAMDLEKESMHAIVQELKNRQLASGKDSVKENLSGLKNRALGHFRRLVVFPDGTRCNCEYFRTKGWCDEQRIYDLAEFNKYPPMECQLADGTSWPAIALKCRSKLKKPTFDKNIANHLLDNLHPPPSIDPSKTLPTTPHYDVILPMTLEGKLGILIKLTREDTSDNSYHYCFAGYCPTANGDKCHSEKACLIRNVGDEIVAIDGMNLCGMSTTDVSGMLMSKKNQRFVQMRIRDTRVKVENKQGGSTIGQPKEASNYN
jgi:hypothetical protein